MTAEQAQRRQERSITPEEAIRAVYIDFEGFQDKRPSILGILQQYDFRQVVLDPRLKPAATAKGLKTSSLKVEVKRLLKECQAEDQPLVAYTQYEKCMIQEYAGIDISPSYRDAHKIAKRWLNRLYRNSDIGEHNLGNHLRFIRFQRPQHLGSGVQTGRLQSVIDGLEARGSYERLTPVQKAKWTKILNHNRIDCCGTRDLVLRASSELGG